MARSPDQDHRLPKLGVGRACQDSAMRTQGIVDKRQECKGRTRNRRDQQKLYLSLQIMKQYCEVKAF